MAGVSVLPWTYAGKRVQEMVLKGGSTAAVYLQGWSWISTSFLDEIRQVTKEFFEQPIEEKKKISKGVEEFEGMS
ncbi:hypothetical protein CK203_059692 [Vitis vinifera]|uniref:Uncharacterized protein n=1 Tax=Vitis vinifera TaxID=29760 RepID=A0A438GFM5_VITVI|nr:hypothetical protein CK203_059692 [Vitis vinifera]